jgi:hypothetical protein
MNFFGSVSVPARASNNHPLHTRSCSKTGSRRVAIGLIACRGRASLQAGNDPNPLWRAFDAYSKCVAQQMKMTAEDAQRLVKDFQYITQKVTQSLRR